MVVDFGHELSHMTVAQKERLRRIAIRAYEIASIVFIAYILASAVTSCMIVFMLNDQHLSSPQGAKIVAPSESFAKNINSRELHKVIEERNIFNSEGKLPDEPDPSEIRAQQGATFDDTAPCSKISINLTLLGTIFLGENGPSLATIQEAGFPVADIYRKGDPILGHESAKIHQIEQKKVIINNAGKKECLELDAGLPALASNGPGGGSLPTGQNVSGGVSSQPADFGDGGGGCSSAVLDEKLVSAQSNDLISKLSLIPHVKDGQHVGYKIMSLDSSSIFGKSCLKSGDVITQVNDTPMTPDKGFSFYEAFTNERTIRIGILRGGVSPATINIEIKQR